jgi:hypothetical protein
LRPCTPLDLIEAITAAKASGGSIVFGGTLAAKGGARSAERFEFALVDEKLGRRIAHGYDIETLPVLG